MHGFTDPAFTKTVTGQGIVRGEFLYNADETPLCFAKDLRYEFTDAAPVPEPSSVLLFGTGAAMAAWRRRRSFQ